MISQNYMITFINETDLPIMVGSFIPVINIEGLNKFIEFIVMPNEKTIIPSITGECFLSNHFDQQEHKKKWIDKKLNKIYSIGKFNVLSYIRDNYSCMDTDVFNVIYENENKVFKFIYNY